MAADSGHDHDEKKGCKKGFKIGATMTSTYLTQGAKALHFQAASPPLHIQVSRNALTKKFGLPGMGLLWQSKDQNHRFLTPDYDTNPEMPCTPGAPGLLLSCRKEMCNGKTWTLFVKVKGGSSVRLNYAGEYSCKVVGKLTAVEFSGQDFRVG